MERVLGAVGRVSVKLRWLVVLAWVVVTVVCVHFLPSLSSVVDTQNSAFLPSSELSVQAAQLEAPFQSANAAQGLLVASNVDGKVLTPADQQAITAAEKAVEKVPHVISPVKDLATSTNGKAEVASVEANVPVSGSAADREVAAIRGVLAQSSFDGVPVPPGLAFNLTGTLAISADNASANKAAQARTEALTYLIILVILLLVYRSALAWLVNLIPAGIVLALSEPVVGELAKHGLPASAVTPVMMTVLVLGAGTDYGLFLIMRFREELESGLHPHRAVVGAMQRVGESVTYAGLTVAGALFCLIFSSFGIYKGLGPSLAVAILLMLLASLTLTPALLAIFSRKTFWPVRVKAGPHREGLWGRVAEGCAGRPVVTLVSGIAILGICVLGMIGFTTTGFSGGSSSPSTSDSAKGTAVLAANFPSSILSPTDLILTFAQSVWTAPGGLDDVSRAEHSFAASKLVKTVSGSLDPVGYALTPEQLALLYKTLGPPGSLPTTAPASLTAQVAAAYPVYRAVAQYVSADGKTVQYAVTLPSGTPTDAASVAGVPGLRALTDSVAAQVGATDSGVYGIAAYSYDVENVANHDLLVIFPIVALVIGVLLGLLLHSVVSPVFLLLSVALSYGSTLGLTNALFVHLGGGPGINFVLPFLLFVFLVALGEDYNILVMSRIREESLQHGTEPHGVRTAVVTAVGATGTTVTSAGIILAGTFAAVAVAGGSSQLDEIGTALALGILLDTFLVRTLLVPSTAQLLGRWTWWPSRLGRMAGPGHTGAPATPHEEPAAP